MNSLAKLFNLKSRESRKTFLLYGMHFIFYLGLRWGENANEALFLEYWSSKDLGTMFIWGSLLAFAIGILYTAYADRIDNEKMLIIMLGGMVVWLVSVRVLLDTNGGPGGWVYPYFYLVYDALNGLATLHILNYINDFYDTRAAKRAIPLMLSAGIIASALAGFVGDALEQTVGLENIPIAWIVCLFGVLGFVLLNRHYLSSELTTIQLRTNTKTSQASTLQNLKTGFEYVKGSGLLRWLALSTFLMLFILKLLTYHAGTFFEIQFDGNPEGRFSYLTMVDGIGYTLGLLIQIFLFNRLLARLGVGNMAFAYPILTFTSFAALVYRPDWATAIFGRLDVSTFKRAIRNPLDAMLYNGVPPNIKGRAKGFINAVLVAMGTLLAGLLLYALKQAWIPANVVDIFGLIGVVIFVYAAFKLRENYSRSLTELLKENTLNLFAFDDQEFQEIDPAAIEMLHKKLDETVDDTEAVFLAEMIYEIQGAKALPFLYQHARKNTPVVRASIIQMLGADGIKEPEFYELCLNGITDFSPSVRHASALILAQSDGIEQNIEYLDVFFERMQDDDTQVLEAIIPPMISSGDFYYLAPAVQQLSVWLGNKDDAIQRRAGLHVLVKIKNERLIQTLVRYLKDEDPRVRQCAVELIDDISAQAASKEIKQHGLDILSSLLADHDPAVRLAAVNGLSHFKNMEASQVLLKCFSDENFLIRKQACIGLNPLPRQELIEMRGSGSPLEVECACYVLAVNGYSPAQRQIPGIQENLLRAIYQIYALQIPITPFSNLGAGLLNSSLSEKAEHLIERVFWLAEAVSNANDIQMIRMALHSSNRVTQANAIETLDSLTSPLVAQLVAPVFDGSDLNQRLEIARNTLNIAPYPGLASVYQQFWPEFEEEPNPQVTAIFEPSTQDWLQAVTILSVIEQLVKHNAGDVSRTAVMVAMVNTEKTQNQLVQEALRYASTQLLIYTEKVPTERPMLTLIEKVIFLKEVQFFQEFSIEQLRTLAGICEEKHIETDETIFSEGDREDALYIVVSGRIALQRKVHRKITRIAEYETRQYFAEMSIFDAKTHYADALALEPSVLLLIRPAPLSALVEHYPALAMKLLKVLSQRLREANDAIADKSEAKNESLVNIFDKLG